MNTPPKRLQRPVERAAELRVSGLSWPQVAQKMCRNVKTIQEWQRYYPEHWKQLVETARQAQADEGADEAVSVLRNQLRGEEYKVTQVAARELISNKRSLDVASTPPVPSVLHRFVDYLEGLTDEQFTTLVGERNLEITGRPPVAVVDVENPPGAA
ncbi:MAG: hypothetical protein EXS09_10785 [Gemmataceae bacterium]|nr:hypothetical protein [Gemmataceae bacterium]